MEEDKKEKQIDFPVPYFKISMERNKIVYSVSDERIKIKNR